MENRERVFITEAVLTVGALIVIKKMRDRKKRVNPAYESRKEFIVLLRDFVDWLEKEAPKLEPDNFVAEYNNRVEFINIVTSS